MPSVVVEIIEVTLIFISVEEFNFLILYGPSALNLFNIRHHAIGVNESNNAQDTDRFLACDDWHS